MTITTKKVSQLSNTNTLADNDIVVGDRSGTTQAFTVSGIVFDSDFSSNGMMARTASGTYTTHTIAGTTDKITVTNGDGVSGAPTITVASTYVGQTSITTLGTIATGTWQGTAVGVAYGGTGQTSYTDGQLLIGNTTGNTLTKASLTAGTGITVTPGSGSITLAVADNYLLNTGDTGTGTYIFSDIDIGDMDFENQSGSGVIYWDGGGTSGNYCLKGTSGFPVIQGQSADYRIQTENDGWSFKYGSGNTLRLDDGGSTWSGPAAVTVATGDEVFLRDVSASNVIGTATAVSIRDLTPTAGFTGTGAEVRGTSPTLVTPTLGVASATSINFGDDALSNYDEGFFTPTFTCATPGDLSVGYSTQSGLYTRIGRFVVIRLALVFTPTFTTASGQMRFAGLPFTVGSSHSGSIQATSNTIIWPAGVTTVFPLATGGQTYCVIQGVGTAAATSTFNISTITSGVAQTITINAYYSI